LHLKPGPVREERQRNEPSAKLLIRKIIRLRRTGIFFARKTGASELGRLRRPQTSSALFASNLVAKNRFSSEENTLIFKAHHTTFSSGLGRGLAAS